MRILLRNALVGLAALAFVMPAFAKDAAAEATVVCKDGSSSKAGRGACRGHGGVDKEASAKADRGAAAPAAEAKGKKAAAAEEKAAEAKGKKAAEPEEKGAETTVVCKDGSTSKGGRGACRGHGGVDKTATAKGAGAAAAAPAPQAPAHSAAPQAPPPAAAPRAPAAPAQAAAPAATAAQRAEKTADEKGPPTARCKDGTLSYSQHHSGACSRHGGVAEWLDKDKK